MNSCLAYIVVVWIGKRIHHLSGERTGAPVFSVHAETVSVLIGAAVLDRELARFIYVREVKWFDPFKFSIYAWCIKIAIAGSLANVRLAWVPILGVPKNRFIYVEADTKKLYAGL